MNKILIDTNIIIYRENHKIVDEKLSHFLAMMYNSEKYKIVVHPLSIEDLKRNPNKREKEIILSKVSTYSIIDNPPLADDNFHKLVGCKKIPNDEIDNNLLFAVFRNCVSFLVTNDKELRKKAKVIGLENRVLDVDQAIECFAPSKEELVYFPIAIKHIPLHNINVKQSFFDSLREGYWEFEEWYKKKSLEGEYAYCSYVADEQLGSFLMVKLEGEEESFEDYEKPLERKRRIKISTMKVSDRGKHIGESFLRIVFEEAFKQRVSEIYATLYEEQDELIHLLKEFGFTVYTLKQTKDGNGELKKELVLLKIIGEHDYPNIDWRRNTFIIPILPVFHRLLFPNAETNYQLDIWDLSPEKAYSNAIKKAYFTNTNSKLLSAGDVICFYSSHDRKSITVIGTIEEIFSEMPSAEYACNIARRRTVYELSDIQSFFGAKTKLLLFRENKVLENPISLSVLKEKGIIKGAPQSVTRVNSQLIEQIVKENEIR